MTHSIVLHTACGATRIIPYQGGSYNRDYTVPMIVGPRAVRMLEPGDYDRPIVCVERVFEFDRREFTPAPWFVEQQKLPYHQRSWAAVSRPIEECGTFEFHYVERLAQPNNWTEMKDLRMEIERLKLRVQSLECTRAASQCS
jgi:hypothetical protein